jgi:hypothetical protein
VASARLVPVILGDARGWFIAHDHGESLCSCEWSAGTLLVL